MLKQRVITAAIALPLVLLPFLLRKDYILVPFFCIGVGLAAYEIGQMMLPRLEAIFRSGRVDSGRVEEGTQYILALGVIIACATFLGVASDTGPEARGILIVSFLSTFLFGAFLAPNNDLSIGRSLSLLCMLAYGALPFLALWELYLMGERSGYVFLTMAIVWGGDTGAYFGGKSFGRTKLAPRMSPNKTVEGAIFGLLGSVSLGLAINAFWAGTLGSWPTIVLASLLGGVSGQMGDLVESTLKRFALVKDSGQLFPGHGGFMDRVDGLLFGAPVVWIIFYLAHY